MESQSTDNDKCIRNAYFFLDTAIHIWKNPTIEKELELRKAAYFHTVAKGLTDDDCGQRVALLNEVMVEDLPQYIIEDYNTWKKQNEQVYFQVEETNFTPAFPLLQNLLKDLFQILPKTS